MLMSKFYICLFLLLIVLAQQPSKGTQGYYLSAQSLSKQQEVHEAVDKIKSNITVQKTTYSKGGISYSIDNVSIDTTFLDSQQKIQIVEDNNVKVSGGKFQFDYIFNYSKVEAGRTTNGYAAGTVISDSFNYSKKLDYGTEGFLIWLLVDQSLAPLTITNDLKVRRMEPFSDADVLAIEDILGKASSGVSPSTAKNQILQKFNNLMLKALNDTLNLHILGEQIKYTFQSPRKGSLSMTIVHHISDYLISSEDGYKVIFLSTIKGEKQLICDGASVPSRHLMWDLYGGTQNIQLICLYQEVVEFLLKKGWLDQKLDTDWDCNAFQFYAGDLYQIIPNISESVSPRELLSINCMASPNGLTIKNGRVYFTNVLALDAKYNCIGTSRNKNMTYVDVLNFTAQVRLIIKAEPNSTALGFTVYMAEIVEMIFEQVNQFRVTNLQLAYFKASQVLDQLRGTKLFGTGFPIVPLQVPSSLVLDNYDAVVYFDKSQRAQFSSI